MWLPERRSNRSRESNQQAGLVVPWLRPLQESMERFVGRQPLTADLVGLEADPVTPSPHPTKHRGVVRFGWKGAGGLMNRADGFGENVGVCHVSHSFLRAVR